MSKLSIVHPSSLLQIPIVMACCIFGGCSGTSNIDYVLVSLIDSEQETRVAIEVGREIFDLAIGKSLPGDGSDAALFPFRPPYSYRVVFVFKDHSEKQIEVSESGYLIGLVRDPAVNYHLANETDASELATILKGYCRRPLERKEAETNSSRQFETPELPPFSTE
jgi:hypothetical protein